MNKKKLFNIDQLIGLILKLKKKNLSIGFTNGCFDLLHKGHLSLLFQSKKKCDYLVVAINSDNSTKQLKGDDRPKDNQSVRIYKLSNLDEVDAIIIFNEDNPLKLITAIKPDILFKGSDYNEKEIVGADFIMKNGGKIELIDILVGYSTTNIINNSSTL